MALSKWQSAVLGAISGRDEESDQASTASVAGQSRWRRAMMTAIYGNTDGTETGAEEKSAGAGAESGVAKETKPDPAAVAERIFARAEAKRNSVLGVFGSIAGGGEAVEEAEELYLTAAYKFKTASKWDRAGLSYANAAKMAHCLGQFHQEALHLGDAARCFKRVDPGEALKCLQTAADLMIDCGKYSKAGTILQWMAELHEETQNWKMAGECFGQAADFFREEGVRNGSAAKCLLKTADYTAMEGEYRRAIDIYEEVGFSRADHHLLKWGAKDLFFKSALLHLCCDVVIARASVERYEDHHPAFEGSRENILIRSLIDAVEECDVASFDSAVKKYEQITKLNPWTQKHVDTIRKGLLDEEIDLK